MQIKKRTCSFELHNLCVDFGGFRARLPRLSGLWRTVAGHVRMGRGLNVTWEGTITRKLSRGSVERMRTLVWGWSDGYPVTGLCFLGKENYKSCLGATCKKECHELFWTKKYHKGERSLCSVELFINCRVN